MSECSICGVSDAVESLWEVISGEGLIKVCRKCAESQDLPVIKKPTNFQLKEAQRPYTVYERLSKAAGIDPVEHALRTRGTDERESRKKEELRKEEMKLKDLIDKNLKINNPTTERQDLIRNFHWALMMARRRKHLTLKQVSDAISEPEVAIKLAEQGFLPVGNNRLIDNLETYFDIKIRETRKTDFGQTQSSQQGYPSSMQKNIPDFKPETLKNLTIADLREMKKKREEEKKVEGEKFQDDALDEAVEEQSSDEEFWEEE